MKKTICDYCKKEFDYDPVLLYRTIGKKSGKGHKSGARLHDDIITFSIYVSSDHDICKVCILEMTKQLLEGK